MFWDYFIDFYIGLQLSYSMPVTEGVSLLCAVLAVNAVDGRPRTILRSVVHFLLLWAAVILLKSFLYGTAVGHYTMTYIPAVCALVYALIAGDLPFEYRAFNIIYYLIVHVFSTSFSKSCGAVICGFAHIVYEEWMASLSMVIVRTLLFGGYLAVVKAFPMSRAGGIARLHYVFAMFILVAAYVAKIIVDNIKDFTNGIINPTETEYAPFVFFLGFLLYVLTAISYFSCRYQTMRQARSKLLEEEIGDIRDRFERSDRGVTRKEMDEIRKIRHDMKNQMAYIKLMLDQRKYEEMSRYFDSLSDSVRPSLGRADCDNRVVGGVLDIETGKLPDGVRLEHRLAVSGKIAIEDIDLMSLLVNLLDNAVEACARDNVKGEISLDMRETEGYLFITVKNPIADEKSASRVFEGGTSKSDEVAHGYGTGIVAAIADRYDGMVKYTVRDGYFIADVMLTLRKDGGCDGYLRV